MTNIMTVAEINESKKKVIEAFRDVSIAYSEIDERFLAICMSAAFDPGTEFSDEDEEFFTDYLETLNESTMERTERLTDVMQNLRNPEVASVIKDIMKAQITVFNEMLESMN